MNNWIGLYNFLKGDLGGLRAEGSLMSGIQN